MSSGTEGSPQTTFTGQTLLLTSSGKKDSSSQCGGNWENQMLIKCQASSWRWMIVPWTCMNLQRCIFCKLQQCTMQPSQERCYQCDHRTKAKRQNMLPLPTVLPSVKDWHQMKSSEHKHCSTSSFLKATQKNLKSLTNRTWHTSVSLGNWGRFAS